VRRLLAALLVVLTAGCGGGEQSVTGSLVDIDATLTEVRGFTLLTPEGDRLEFTPGAGATFHGGPLSHLTDHLRTGARVTVFYEEEPGGGLVATQVEDG